MYTIKQLVISDTSVKWYRGLWDTSTLEAVYCVDTKILQAFWCFFEDQEIREHSQTKKSDVVKCLCIREESQLNLFLEDGVVYYVPLPFKVIIFTIIAIFFIRFSQCGLLKVGY